MKIMVLNDGETYTSVNGCRLIQLPDDFEPNDIDDALRNVRDGVFDVNVQVVATMGEHGEWKNG